MEDNVWSKKEVFDIINDEYVLVSLYVDDRKELPKELQGEITIKMQDGTKKQKKIKQLVTNGPHLKPMFSKSISTILCFNKSRR